MQRRTFLQTAAATGLGLLLPTARSTTARAAVGDGRYAGPYWLLVQCAGGWDPTYVCDPKGGDINRLYAANQSGTSGNLRYAPIEYRNGSGQIYYANQQFFDKYRDRLLVVNGIDTTTLNHDQGARATWSGSLGEGHPTFGALVAAARAPATPLGFVSNGGYEANQGLAPVTRLGDIDLVRSVAEPDRFMTRDGPATFHTAATRDRIRRAQADRLARLTGAATLPSLRAGISALHVARADDRDLEEIAQYLPSQAELDRQPSLLFRQGLVALAGFRAGLVVAANLLRYTFDTHDNHEARQLPLLGEVLHGVDLILDQAARLGLADRIIVVIGSDFARTPAYNAYGGKDHWNVTSMMFLGPGIAGNRVVGATDGGQRALPVGGVRLSYLHVHRALRRLAGVEGTDLDPRFPVVAGDELPVPLFG